MQNMRSVSEMLKKDQENPSQATNEISVQADLQPELFQIKETKNLHSRLHRSNQQIKLSKTKCKSNELDAIYRHTFQFKSSGKINNVRSKDEFIPSRKIVSRRTSSGLSKNLVNNTSSKVNRVDTYKLKEILPKHCKSTTKNKLPSFDYLLDKNLYTEFISPTIKLHRVQQFAKPNSRTKKITSSQDRLVKTPKVLNLIVAATKKWIKLKL